MLLRLSYVKLCDILEPCVSPPEAASISAVHLERYRPQTHKGVRASHCPSADFDQHSTKMKMNGKRNMKYGGTKMKDPKWDRACLIENRRCQF